MTDGAQPVVPRLAATVMLLRDSDGPEVLLLRRSSATPFVPGAHVFPGGALEAGDAAIHDDLIDGLEAVEAERVLGVTGDARAFWVAAVRECLEEAGVLLATDGRGRPVAHDHDVFADLAGVRAAVEHGLRPLASLYRDHGLRLPLGSIAYVSRWITPAFSPRRYDARFFAAAMPPGQRSTADGWEAVDAAWWRPATALDDWEAGRIELIGPTVASLRLLSRFATAHEALEAVQQGARRTRRVAEPSGGERVPLPVELDEIAEIDEVSAIGEVGEVGGQRPTAHGDHRP